MLPRFDVAEREGHVPPSSGLTSHSYVSQIGQSIHVGT
jgi:hypothetical protein